MSRHRNVRTMDYSEDYDGYDDVYGHSLEDEYSVSPSTAAFMYDRNSSRPTVSAFLNYEDEIVEEGELEEDLKMKELNDIDEARLRSSLDEARNVVGDYYSDDSLKKAILDADFDLPQALYKLLNVTQPAKKQAMETPKPQRPKRDNTVKSDILVTAPEKVEANATVITARNVTPVRGFKVENPTDNLSSTSKKSLSAKENVEKKREETPTVRKVRPVVDLNKGKQSVHLLVAGHVDAGKSTLIGHLLVRLGNVSQKLMHKYQQETRKVGKQSFVYAWILDETSDERERGITMDIGQSKFETETKVVSVLDAPGHKDFIPNMIMGAAQADAALLVVDSTRGEFETGFEAGGQTREHAILIRSLGVSQVIVVVNKLETVNWSENRFEEIRRKLGSFLRQVGFKPCDISYIPCSGLSGANLTEPYDQIPWYSGPTLIQLIDKFKCPERPVDKPLRVSINDIFKQGSGLVVSGRVETGIICQGDQVVVLPHGESASVKSLTIDEESLSAASAGDYISINLASFDPQNVSIGSVLCDPDVPVSVSSRFHAKIVVFNPTLPVTRGFPVVLHLQFLCEQATVSKILSELDKSTGEVVKKRPRCLTKNSSGQVEIQVARPICLELYRDVKELGRFMLRSAGVTIAAGLITKIL